MEKDSRTRTSVQIPICGEWSAQHPVGVGIATRNPLVSICTGTIKKLTRLFHRDSPVYSTVNALPTCVSFCFGDLDDSSQGDNLVNSLGNLCKWCSELGIRNIVAYDKLGILKKRRYDVKSVIPRDARLISCGEGEVGPLPAEQEDTSSEDTQDSGHPEHLEVVIMDSMDGRPLLSRVARKIAEDRRGCELNILLLLDYIKKRSTIRGEGIRHSVRIWLNV